MNWALTGGLIMGGSVLLLLALLAVRLLRYRDMTDPESQSEMESEEFFATRYEPMARLVTPDDLAFLSSLPGYRSEVGAKLRRDRSRIFRMYLRELADDFHRLHSKARKMVTESQEPHAELVGILIRQQLTFWRAIAFIELRMLAPGAKLPKIDVPGLVETIEAMRSDLARITAPAALQSAQ
jgi:hypothetical protein